MQYRLLGRTGIRVSEVSFGSHLSAAQKADPAWRARVVRLGLERGINCFDIYEHSYQQFEPMSRTLADVMGEVVLSLVTIWEVGRIGEEIDYARRVFRREAIDLYRVVIAPDWGVWEPRLEALLKAKEQGKVRAVGGVVHYPADLRRALERYGGVLEYVMAPATFWSTLVLDETRDLAAALRRHGTGLMVMKPMGAGADQGYLHRLHPGGEEMARLRAKGLSLGKLAIKSLLQSRLVSTVLPAMNSEAEVLENTSASGDGPLTDDEKRFLDLYRAEADRSLPQLLPAHEYWMTAWRP